MSRSATAPVPTAVAFTLLALDIVPIASDKSPDIDLTPRATAPLPDFVALKLVISPGATPARSLIAVKRLAVFEPEPNVYVTDLVVAFRRSSPPIAMDECPSAIVSPPIAID